MKFKRGKTPEEALSIGTQLGMLDRHIRKMGKKLNLTVMMNPIHTHLNRYNITTFEYEIISNDKALSFNVTKDKVLKVNEGTTLLLNVVQNPYISDEPLIYVMNKWNQSPRLEEILTDHFWTTIFKHKTK